MPASASWSFDGAKGTSYISLKPSVFSRLLLLVMLNLSLTSGLIAQDAPEVPSPSPSAQEQARAASVQAQNITNTNTFLANNRITWKNKSDYANTYQQVWGKLVEACATPTPAGMTHICALEALSTANSECVDSTAYFRRDTKKWQVLSIVLTLSSAGFTAAGASATLSQAKVFSTFGGTTGLAAILPTLNANATADQTALTTVSTTLSQLQSYPGTPQAGPGSTSALPTDDQIFQHAMSYGAICSTAAGAAPSTTPSSKPTS